jgi:hypothetical protein
MVKDYPPLADVTWGLYKQWYTEKVVPFIKEANETRKED